ncbi:Lsr2 family protein [Mycolicibacterium sp. Y3]
MAERIIRQLVDDLDGSAIADGAGEHIEFGLRGTTYAIDLSDVNAAKLDDALKIFIAAARRTGGRHTVKAARTTQSESEGRKARLTAIRQWARKQGYDVSSRGRISAEIVAEFDATH